MHWEVILFSLQEIYIRSFNNKPNSYTWIDMFLFFLILLNKISKVV